LIDWIGEDGHHQATVSQDLSKLDRKIVHEIAEELGIEHVSYGEDGANRQIHLKMPVAGAGAVAGESDCSEKGDSAAAHEVGEKDEIDGDLKARNVAAANDGLQHTAKTIKSFEL
jgi:R3H domain